MVANMQPRDGYVVLKYKGLSAGTRVYRGGKTNTNYRFGNNAAHRMSYVYQEDLEHLLSLSDGGRPLFELIQSAKQQAPEGVTLTTAGPPVRPSAGVAKLATEPTGPGPAVVEEILRGARVEVATTPEDVEESVLATGNAIVEVPVEELREYSVSEMRKGLDDWPIEKVALYLAHEKVRAEPRTTAITLLERRLRQGGSDWTNGSST
jgi:hypothetical protein